MKTCLIFIFTHGPTTQQLSPLVFDQSHWPFASQLQRGALTTLFGSFAHLIALHLDAFGVYITFDLSVVYSSANRNRFFFGLSCFVHLSPSHSGGMEQPSLKLFSIDVRVPTSMPSWKMLFLSTNQLDTYVVALTRHTRRPCTRTPPSPFLLSSRSQRIASSRELRRMRHHERSYRQHRPAPVCVACLCRPWTSNWIRRDSPMLERSSVRML